MAEGRILYVEDNFDNRILIKRVLEAEGYTVIEAKSGREGLELARTGSPDLILMDINLPDVDGYECTRLLQAADATRAIPILALTANVLEGDRQKALGAGCSGYVAKPIDVDELPRKIAGHLDAAARSGRKAAPTRADQGQPWDARPPGAMDRRENGRSQVARRTMDRPTRANLGDGTPKDEPGSMAARRSPDDEKPAAPSRNIGASTHERTAP